MICGFIIFNKMQWKKRKLVPIIDYKQQCHLVLSWKVSLQYLSGNSRNISWYLIEFSGKFSKLSFHLFLKFYLNWIIAWFYFLGFLLEILLSQILLFYLRCYLLIFLLEALLFQIFT